MPSIAYTLATAALLAFHASPVWAIVPHKPAASTTAGVVDATLPTPQTTLIAKRADDTDDSSVTTIVTTTQDPGEASLNDMRGDVDTWVAPCEGLNVPNVVLSDNYQPIGEEECAQMKIGCGYPNDFVRSVTWLWTDQLSTYDDVSANRHMTIVVDGNDGPVTTAVPVSGKSFAGCYCEVPNVVDKHGGVVNGVTSICRSVSQSPPQPSS